MHCPLRPLIALWILSLALSGAAAQTDPAAELIAAERAREALTEAVNRVLKRDPTNLAAHDLVAEIGVDGVPMLIEELERADPDTYFVAVYSLGLLDTLESTEALRAAIVAADNTTNDFGLSRKAWAAWALGLHGHPEAIYLVNEGRRFAGSKPMHRDTTVLEAIALQTGAEAIPVIASELERLTSQEAQPQRAHLIAALGRTGSPQALPILHELAGSPDVNNRLNAVEAMIDIASEARVPLMLERLEDINSLVRAVTAESLEKIRPASAWDTVVKRLEVETDPTTRGLLYRLAAGLRGPGAAALLKDSEIPRDPTEQRLFAEGLVLAADPSLIERLRGAVAGRDNRTGIAAAQALARIPDESARTLLIETVKSSFWPRATTAIDELIRLDDRDALPTIRQRLFEFEMSKNIVDVGRRGRALRLIDALVELTDTASIDRLKQARETQTDQLVKDRIDQAIERLAVQKRNGDRFKKWSDSLELNDLLIRRTAIEFLGNSGKKEAGEILIGRYDSAERDERLMIIEALGSIDTGEVRTFVRRFLSEPRFDHPRHHAERAMAAWTARRLGGADMLEALTASGKRREGQDAYVLIYAALLGGETSLDLIRDTRALRFRYMNWMAGVETRFMDRLVARIQSGGSLDDFDVSPEEIEGF